MQNARRLSKLISFGLEGQVLHSDPSLHKGLYSRIPVLAQDTQDCLELLEED